MESLTLAKILCFACCHRFQDADHRLRFCDLRAATDSASGAQFRNFGVIWLRWFACCH